MTKLVIPICGLVFLISSWTGFWDRWFGLHHVEKAAESFEKSYGPDASHFVRPGDTAWKPILKLINKYSTANLPKNGEPKVLARYKAVSSEKIQSGDKIIAQWTAPTTPIVLIYKDWPGQAVEPEYYRFVGSIADLRLWIRNSKDDFRFFVQSVVLGVSIVIVTTVWIVDRPPKPLPPDPLC
jgi:hypothetical protein